MSQDSQEEYDEEFFLDELRSPYHRGSCPLRTHTGMARNPICGDEVVWHLRLSEDRVEAAWHEARGCAISQVSASLRSSSDWYFDRASVSARNHSISASGAVLTGNSSIASRKSNRVPDGPTGFWLSPFRSDRSDSSRSSREIRPCFSFSR